LALKKAALHSHASGVESEGFGVDLAQQQYLRETVQRLIRRGIVPQEDGWNGWLGRYQKALGDTAATLERRHLAKEA